MIKKPQKVTENDWKLLKNKYPYNLEDIVKKINQNYPVQYLIGNVNFYGYTILVNPDVLIPRFESEYLIEHTLKYIKQYNFKQPKIIDLGTGSGCLSIALKKNILDSTITALDCSIKALAVAKKNIRLNNVEINLEHKDILRSEIEGKYDIIISNPPYISQNIKVDPAIFYEPKNAIFAEEDGLIFYKRIAQLARKILNYKAMIALEISYNQANEIKKIFADIIPSSKIIIKKDYNNFDRYVFILINCE